MSTGSGSKRTFAGAPTRAATAPASRPSTCATVDRPLSASHRSTAGSAGQGLR